MPRVRKNCNFPKVTRTPRDAVSSAGSDAGAMNLSITIRTGRGVNLGSNSSLALLEYLERFPDYSFSVEKSGLAGHFQGAIKSDGYWSPKEVKGELVELFKKHDPEWNEKNEKYAIKVVAHDNWQGLLSYTRKDRRPFHGWSSLPCDNRFCIEYDPDKYSRIDPNLVM